MERDPYFKFNPDLPDVSRFHSATGVISCNSGNQAILTITVDDGSSADVRVTRTCSGSWVRLFPGYPLYNDVDAHPALQYVSAVYGDSSPGMVIARTAAGGFNSSDIDAAFAEMDTRVVSQFVPDFVAPRAPPTAAPITPFPTPSSGSSRPFKMSMIGLEYCTIIAMGFGAFGLAHWLML